MSLYDEALAYAEKEEWLTSVAIIDQILMESAELEKSQVAFLFYQQGYFYSNAKEYNAAIVSLSRSLELYVELEDFQNTVLALVFKAKLLLSLEEAEKAIFYLTRAYGFLDVVPVNLQIYICENLALAWEEIACFVKALYYWHECTGRSKTDRPRFLEQEQRVKQNLFL